MKSFKDYILNERVLSIGLNPEHDELRELYRDEIHNLLRKSYERAGGYSGLPSGSPEESQSIHDDISNLIIKAVRRGDHISAVSLYKPQFGRKAVGIATDGTVRGKLDFKKTAIEDHEQERAWAEVSGAPEQLYKRWEIPVVSNRHASELTGKPDIELDPDGEYYTRKIGPERHKKVIMGHPKFPKSSE